MIVTGLLPASVALPGTSGVENEARALVPSRRRLSQSRLSQSPSEPVTGLEPGSSDRNEARYGHFQPRFSAIASWYALYVRAAISAYLSITSGPLPLTGQSVDAYA